MLVFFGAFLFSSWHLAYAGLMIHEVMYDLSGSDSTNSKSREWVEIYNPDGSDVSIDASAWRIYDGGANRTINGEVNFSIPAGAHVIFAGDKDTFLIDNPSFSGTVYDTGITTLNNTGATLKLLDSSLATVDEFNYASSQGGAGDGNTLQKISGAWSGATPTPGAANSSGALPGSGSGGGSVGSSSGGTAPQTTETKKPVVYEIKTNIQAKTSALAGIPIYFEATSYGHSGERLASGKYFWNFGDGGSREVKANYEEKFSHIYFYPGEYAVSLEYYSGYYSEVLDATDKMTIKVIEPGVIISNLGNETDFFIELSNEASSEADISKWVLQSDRVSFVFPKNTILGPKKKIMLSPYLTGLNYSDKNSLKLMSSQGEVMYDNHAVAEPVKVSGQTVKAVQAVSKNEYPVQVGKIVDQNAFIPSENLAANALSVDRAEGKEKNSLIPVMAFVLFISLASGALYLVRKMKNLTSPGDDFELLDE